MFYDDEFSERKYGRAGGLPDPAGGYGPRYDRLLRLPEVRHLTGLGGSTIYEKIEAGSFPRQIKIGPKMVAWRESEVLAWIASPT